MIIVPMHLVGGLVCQRTCYTMPINQAMQEEILQFLILDRIIPEKKVEDIGFYKKIFSYKHKRSK